MMGGMASPLPLSALLSQALVAFTIEFDNTAESRMAHRTTSSAAAAPGRGPWLVSQVMWSNVMQYVTEDGITIDELIARARTTRLQLDGLQRWGYVRMNPERGARSGDGSTVVRATKSGMAAREVWRPMAGEIETRWEERFGAEDVHHLKNSLSNVVDRIEVELPSYMPIVYPSQNGKAEPPQPRPQPRLLPGPKAAAEPEPTPDLSVLLSRALLAFTLDFEQESKISLPISANTLRVLSAPGVRVRDLPGLTGVSKEANSMALGFLVRRECVVIGDHPGQARTKVARLTEKGTRAQAKYRRVLSATEEAWVERLGSHAVLTLRHSLERLAVDPAGGGAPLFQGLEPYPENWRATVRRPETLPHYPMVLHRGGYPDGS
jgi:DNA-binding MarR family transcriptional regulator